MKSIQIFAIMFSAGIFTIIIELIRQGKLKERYSLTWLGSSIILLTLSIWKDLLDKLSNILGVAYGPSLLFLMAFLFLLVIVLHFSVAISDLNEKNKKLTQEIAILRIVSCKGGNDLQGSDKTV